MNDGNSTFQKSLLIILMMTHGLSFAQKVPADVVSFYQRDQMLLNACKHSERKRLRRDIFAITREEKPEQVSFLINKVLCGDDIKSYYYVEAHINRGRENDEEAGSAQGDEKEKHMLDTSDYLVRKKAWDASVTGIPGAIRVLFTFDGGVCMRSFDFRYSRDSWWIVANEMDCD